MKSAVLCSCSCDSARCSSSPSKLYASLRGMVMVSVGSVIVFVRLVKQNLHGTAAFNKVRDDS